MAVGSLTTAVQPGRGLPVLQRRVADVRRRDRQLASGGDRQARRPPPRAAGDAAANSLDVAKAKFEIVKDPQGREGAGQKAQASKPSISATARSASTFLIMGIDPPAINWGTPIAHQRARRSYVAKAIELPKEGADRLAFFQDYLEDKDEMLARDAYDEFAKTPYAGVMGLKDRMKHDKLIEWIKSPQIPGQPPAAVLDDAGRVRQARRCCRCWKR